LARNTTIGRDLPLIAEPPIGVDKATNAAWEQMQTELSELPAEGSRIIAPGSGTPSKMIAPMVVVKGVHEIVDVFAEKSFRSHRCHWQFLIFITVAC
jgi:hypothetical protein